MSDQEKTEVLAVDLGASSGRVIKGTYQDGKISLEELHRFENGPKDGSSPLKWDWEKLKSEVFDGIKKGLSASGDIQGVAVDSWGVDFGLLDEERNLIESPVHYRDSRTDGLMDKVFESKVSKRKIFDETGIQFLPFNTIYQLVALKESSPELLEKADQFLMISDLLNFEMTGKPVIEFSNATTTQLYNPQKNSWSEELLSALEIPQKIFSDPVKPGTVIGDIQASMATQLGGSTKVIAVASHDTGSAVAAVPSLKEGFAYLSSGTWSLLGTEVKAPVVSDQCFELAFTNEGGVENTYRLLKNIMGLWILQECRRVWKESGKEYSWEDLTKMAEEAPPFRSLFDPADLRFLPPGDMPQRIADFCRETNQPEPETDGQIVRAILESLAYKYREVLAQLQEMVSEKITTLHIVGGGVQNELLSLWTANACGIDVVAGPVEATALGNIGMQMIALGKIKNVAELRQVIANSFDLDTFRPEATDGWDQNWERYNSLLK